jgi:hypothetical protein
VVQVWAIQGVRVEEDRHGVIERHTVFVRVGPGPSFGTQRDERFDTRGPICGQRAGH